VPLGILSPPTAWSGLTAWRFMEATAYRGGAAARLYSQPCRQAPASLMDHSRTSKKLSWLPGLSGLPVEIESSCFRTLSKAGIVNRPQATAADFCDKNCAIRLVGRGYQEGFSAPHLQFVTRSFSRSMPFCAEEQLEHEERQMSVTFGNHDDIYL